MSLKIWYWRLNRMTFHSTLRQRLDAQWWENKFRIITGWIAARFIPLVHSIRGTTPNSRNLTLPCWYKIRFSYYNLQPSSGQQMWTTILTIHTQKRECDELQHKIILVGVNERSYKHKRQAKLVVAYLGTKNTIHYKLESLRKFSTPLQQELSIDSISELSDPKYVFNYSPMDGY